MRKMKYTIQYETNPHPDDIQILNDGIMKEHKIKRVQGQSSGSSLDIGQMILRVQGQVWTLDK